MKNYFLALIFISLLVFAGCDQVGQETLSSEDLQQIALLPQDANVMGFTNYQKIYQSPFFTSFVDTSFTDLLTDDEYAEFYQQTRLNLQKDIHKIYFAGKTYFDSRKIDALLVARGNFDSEKIKTYIENHQKAEKLVHEMYGGVKFYRTVNGSGAAPFLFGFFDNEFFVGGVDSLVKKWVDSKKANESNPVDHALINRINRLKYKNSAWFILDAKTIFRNLADNPGPEQMIQKIRHLDLSFDMRKKLRFSGEVGCTDAESAGLFRDAIKGAISTMKLSVTDDRELIDILNQIKVKSGDQKIKISFQMSQNDIEKLKTRRKTLKLPTV